MTFIWGVWSSGSVSVSLDVFLFDFNDWINVLKLSFVLLLISVLWNKCHDDFTYKYYINISQTWVSFDPWDRTQPIPLVSSFILWSFSFSDTLELVDHLCFEEISAYFFCIFMVNIHLGQTIRCEENCKLGVLEYLRGTGTVTFMSEDFLLFLHCIYLSDGYFADGTFKMKNKTLLFKVCASCSF